MKKFFQDLYKEDPISFRLMIFGIILIVVLSISYCSMCSQTGVPLFK